MMTWEEFLSRAQAITFELQRLVGESQTWRAEEERQARDYFAYVPISGHAAVLAQWAETEGLRWGRPTYSGGGVGGDDDPEQTLGVWQAPVPLQQTIAQLTAAAAAPALIPIALPTPALMPAAYELLNPNLPNELNVSTTAAAVSSAWMDWPEFRTRVQHATAQLGGLFTAEEERQAWDYYRHSADASALGYNISHGSAPGARGYSGPIVGSSINAVLTELIEREARRWNRPTASGGGVGGDDDLQEQQTWSAPASYTAAVQQAVQAVTAPVVSIAPVAIASVPADVPATPAAEPARVPASLGGGPSISIVGLPSVTPAPPVATSLPSLHAVTASPLLLLAAGVALYFIVKD